MAQHTCGSQRARFRIQFCPLKSQGGTVEASIRISVRAALVGLGALSQPDSALWDSVLITARQFPFCTLHGVQGLSTVSTI